MKVTSTAPASPSPSASAPAPEDGTGYINSLDTALKALVAAEEPIHRLGDDRPKGAALETARQKAAAADAIFYPQGRGELPECRAVDSRRAAAMDALAEAEHARARLLAENAGDYALDEAEISVKRAARVVEREITATAALAGKKEAAKKAALDAAWDRFWPPYLELQKKELIEPLRAALAGAAKIRVFNGFAHSTGACPVSECLPFPSDEYLLIPVVVEDYFKQLQKAVEWNQFSVAKRSAGHAHPTS